MPGYSRIPLAVEVDISDERMTLTSGDREIGDWPLREIAVASKSDGFHIELEDEEIVLSVTESDRFRSVLGSLVASPRPSTSRAMRVGRQTTSTGIRRGGLSVTLEEADFEDVKSRIADLAVAVTSDDVAPAEVFGRWLRLLKEINLRHGQGAMPTPVYYRLNTKLLDLIPEPARPHSTVGR